MKTLYIIDGYLYIYTSLFAGVNRELTSPSGEPTTGTYIFVKTLLKLLKNHEPDMLCVAMDSPHKTFRKQMYSKYKGNRPEGPPEGFSQQVERIEQILKIMGIPVYRAHGFEADDVIGTIVERSQFDWVKVGNDNFYVTICTRDKDVLQLVSGGGYPVDVLDVNKDIRTGEKEVVDKWKIYPVQFIDFLALQGDASDNVPGVRGIGPKKAVELLDKWGGAETVYANLGAIGGNLEKKLREGREDFLLSKDLVTIRRNVPLDIDFKNMEVKEFDWNELNEIFSELGFHSLIQARTRSNRRLF